MVGIFALEMKRLYGFGSMTGTLALMLGGLACAGAARPGRIAPQGIELLAPTTITISNFPLHADLVFQIIREVYAEEGVPLPAIAEGDTLLVSPPVPRGEYEIVYRARLRTGERSHLVSLDALYRTPGGSVTYVLTHDARGELARVWNGQLRVARKLYERRLGKCCLYRAASSTAQTRSCLTPLGLARARWLVDVKLPVPNAQADLISRSTMPTTFESATLNLRLFDMRREPVLRAARSWFLTDFNPESGSELVALASGPQNAAFRMVLGYWDMACSLVTAGAIDAASFRAAHGEVFLTFSKIYPYLAELRSIAEEPEFCRHLEAVVLGDPDAVAIMTRRRAAAIAAARARASQHPPPTA